MQARISAPGVQGISNVQLAIAAAIVVITMAFTAFVKMPAVDISFDRALVTTSSSYVPDLHNMTANEFITPGGLVNLNDARPPANP